MTTPADESYITKAYRMQLYSIMGAVQAFASGLFLALALGSKDHSISLMLTGVAIAGALTLLVTGWRFHREFTTVVSGLRACQGRG